MSKFVTTPLPAQFYSGLENSGKKTEEDAKTFFANRIRRSDRNEVTDEFRKLLVLEAQKPRKVRVKTPRISKKFLTARERRTLGLYRLPKRGLRFAQFTELEGLWESYMREMLGLDQLETSGWAPGMVLIIPDRAFFSGAIGT
jgi:hypothetical protein